MSGVDVGSWTDWAVAVAGGAAALTGLLFVAISINLQAILSHPTLPLRAASTLVLLAVVLFTALAVLIPQASAALGVELLVLAAVLFAATGRYLLFRHRVSDRNWLILPTFVVLVPALLLAIGGVLLLGESANGLYFAAGAVVVGIAGSLLNVWVLMVEIMR